MQTEAATAEGWDRKCNSFNYGSSNNYVPSVATVNSGRNEYISDEEDEDTERHQTAAERNERQHVSQTHLNHMEAGSPIGRWSSIMNELGLTRSPTELKREDMVGKEFHSLQAAEQFFYLYGRSVGFGVRKGHKRKNKDGTIRYRTWLCCKQGHRHEKHLKRVNRIREPKRISREGCNVQLRISYSKYTAKWVVREFFTTHSHPVALQSHIAFLRPNRKISKGTQTYAKVMHRAGMRTARILSYMGQIAGGYDRLGFWPKDLQNCLHKVEDANWATCDAAACIGYLQHKAEHDVEFFAKYSYDDRNRLMNLFWSDSRCQQAYKEFGDRLAFDTTYKCNQYKNPVTIMLGINHHASTTIFGFAILGDETVETYTWVLDTFIECMRGKVPTTIVTDGDLSMKSVIAHVMEGTVHRLCSWHLTQNAISHVKDPGFLPWLKKMMKSKYDEKDFEERWFAGIETFGLQTNGWVSTLFDRRKSWAESFLRGHFFAGMTTTQRCEGMHAYLKTKVDNNSSLLDFIRAIDLALSWLRMMEGKHDFESREYRPVVGRTSLQSIEAQVAEVYTQQVYEIVRQEINREGTYFATKVEEHADTISVTLVKYGNPQKFREVRKSIATNTFSCECNKFPSEGIPCRHIFSSIKALQITNMPESLLLKRWMKNEKASRENLRDSISPGMCNFPWSDQSSRFGQITSKTTELAYYASLSEDLHKFAVTELDKLTVVLQGMSKTYNTRNEQHHSGRRWPDVKNPQLKKTKGAPHTYGNKSLRVCSNCKRPGHNKATCKRMKFEQNNAGTSTEDEGKNTVDVKDAGDNYSISGCKAAFAKNTNLRDHNAFEFPGRVARCSVEHENANTPYETAQWQKEQMDFGITSTTADATLIDEDDFFGGTPFGEAPEL